VTIGKSPKTLDCMESIIFPNESNFAPYVPTVTPMSEEEGMGEEGVGTGAGAGVGTSAGAGGVTGAGVSGVVMSAFASESRPSKIVPPLIKCSIMITNRNSINEQIIILLNILLEICPCEEKVIYILYKYIYIIILYTIHLQCYYYFYPTSLWLWRIWTLDFHWRIFRRCWLIWLVWLIWLT
jgi:hypothetical protein